MGSSLEKRNDSERGNILLKKKRETYERLTSHNCCKTTANLQLCRKIGIEIVSVWVQRNHSGIQREPASQDLKAKRCYRFWLRSMCTVLSPPLRQPRMSIGLIGSLDQVFNCAIIILCHHLSPGRAWGVLAIEYPPNLWNNLRYEMERLVRQKEWLMISSAVWIIRIPFLGKSCFFQQICRWKNLTR